MPEIKINGLGETTVTTDAEGKQTATSDSPLSFEPGLPVTDIRVNLLELVESSVSYEGGVRIFRGTYADGGRIAVTLDSENGNFSSQAEGVIAQITDGDDKSHAVVTYLPKRKSIHKQTH